ncbi:glutaredoxin domain-containing protein [Amycolatopsis palatopharyngis]|uniref:glutaredoxin domain-containing protein n=1 Tax=Amycolatopsis palatopharyngis TaxID=187982 RepID=UPI001FE4CED4|nr:glutaredoxin domain-containing protein [Amycolatopsis palatopharyngis]
MTAYVQPETSGTEEATMTTPDVDQLTVYGAGWCPDVRRSRALLDREGVNYSYVDVEADEAAAAAVRRLQGGQRRIPTVVWPDGTHLVEPSDAELSAALRR